MEIKKITKVALGIAATIILGAIGSGVWEKLLSPFISFLGNTLSSTIAKISSSYSDSIYTKAAILETVDYSDRAAVLIIFIFMVLAFIYSINTLKEIRPVRLSIESVKECFSGWRGVIFSGAFILIIFILISRDSLVRDIQNYSLKHMEIVHPHVTEKEYLLLRSQYLQMTNENDFKEFTKKLSKHFVSNSLVLPEFAPR